MQRGKDDGSKVVRCWLLVARGIWQRSVVLKYKILKYCFFIRAFVASFSVHLYFRRASVVQKWTWYFIRAFVAVFDCALEPLRHFITIPTFAALWPVYNSTSHNPPPKQPKQGQVPLPPIMAKYLHPYLCPLVP